MKKSTYIFFQLLYFPLGWILAIFLGLIVFVLRLLGVIKVKDLHNARRAMKMRKTLKGGMVMLSNHPTMWAEIFFTPLIVTFPYFVWRPFHNFPWCTPKSDLLWIPFIWLWKPLSIRRKNGRPVGARKYQTQKAYLLHVLKQIVNEMPEGGRTIKGPNEIVEVNGKRFRKLKHGYFDAATKKEYCATADPGKIVFLPSWIIINPGFVWRKIEIAFANPQLSYQLPPEKLTEVFANL